MARQETPLPSKARGHFAGEIAFPSPTRPDLIRCLMMTHVIPYPEAVRIAESVEARPECEVADTTRTYRVSAVTVGGVKTVRISWRQEFDSRRDAV